MVNKLRITKEQLNELTVDQMKSLFDFMYHGDPAIVPEERITIGLLFRLIEETRPLVWVDQAQWHIVAKVDGRSINLFGDELIDLLWDIFKLKSRDTRHY